MEEKKSNKGLIVLVVILILIILGLAGYICYDKFYLKEGPTKTVEEKQIAKLSESEIKELNDTLIVNNFDLYLSKNIDFNSIDSTDLLSYVFANYVKLNNIDVSLKTVLANNTSCGEAGIKSNNVVSVAKDEIDKLVVDIFGVEKEMLLNEEDMYFNNGGVFFKYVKNDNKFYLISLCAGDAFEQSSYQKMTKYEQNNDEVYIYDKVVKCGASFVCSKNGKPEGSYVSSRDLSYTGDKGFIHDAEFNKDDTIDYEYLLEKYGDIFNTYKTTFKKASDGKYYWYSSEIVNE